MKNPVIFKLQGSSSPGGAGGIRTRVQTSSKTAFYMLICHLVVENKPAVSRPTCSVSPVVSPWLRGANKTIPTFAMFRIGPPSVGASRRTSSYEIPRLSS